MLPPARNWNPSTGIPKAGIPSAPVPSRMAPAAVPADVPAAMQPTVAVGMAMSMAAADEDDGAVCACRRRCKPGDRGRRRFETQDDSRDCDCADDECFHLGVLPR